MRMSREYENDRGSWYFRHRGQNKVANNWIRADQLTQYLWRYKMADDVSGDPATWRPGDIVAYQFYNEPSFSGVGVYGHLQTVSEVRGNTPFMAQHSAEDYAKVSFTQVVRRLNSAYGRYRENWGYNVLRPKHRGFNVGDGNVRQGDW
jgi:hypothetical protein